jgi:CheY-like chemotaxis protein
MNEAKKRILVADDDPAILDSIQIMLEDAGYEVDISIDGETIYKMEKDYPDLLFLDIWMSGMDGREICRHLKAQESTQDIPIIMISANRDTAKMAKEAGAEDFLEKPFEMEDLLKMAEKYLSD